MKIRANSNNFLLMSVFLLAMLCSAGIGGTISVPGDYDKIQDAIDAASDNDEIEVAPGTYNEAINFKSKAVRLYSSGGPGVTTIDAGGLDSRVVTCNSGEGGDTILEGFTITGGFLENGAGGGMFNGGTSPTVTNCIFSGNLAKYGGGMWNYWASPTVTNCTFSSNESIDRGSGMYSEYYSYPTVTNCTFISNTGSGGYGMWNRCETTSPTVTNCIFWGNSQGQIKNTDYATIDVTYSDVEGGWPGMFNINADPMFADADGRLLAGSPCIDAGNDAAVPADVTTDLDGNPRIQGICVDMGAFERTANPEAMLAGLRTYIVEQVDAGIDAEMEVSLLAKVDAAIAALGRDNPNDAKVALNDLKALVNQVEAQTDKKITPEAAEAIITEANAIIASLEG